MLFLGLILRKSCSFRFTVVDSFIVLFLFSVVLSTIVNISSLDQKQVNHTISWFVCFLLFFYVNRLYLDRIDMDEVFAILRHCYVIVLIFCIAEFFSSIALGIDLNQYIPRPQGRNYEASFLFVLPRSRAFFTESGYAGMYIALTYPFVIYQMKRDRFGKLYKAILLILTVLAAFTIYSTTLFLFFPLIFFIVFLFSSRKLFKKFLVIVPILGVALVCFWSYIWSFLDVLIFYKFNTSSSDIRSDNMHENIEYIKHSSVLQLIFGHGPGSYFKAGLTDAAPSIYVNVLRDSGVIGLICYLCIWVSAFLKLFFMKNCHIKPYLLVMICLILIYHVSNMDYNFVFLWFVLAAIVESKRFNSGDKKSLLISCPH